MKRIPYGRQTISEDDINSVIKILRSDYLTQGSTIAQFEKALADYCGVRYAVTFSNGTAALHGACFAANISQGDEVITTPLTFAASANCVLYCEGKPIFADIKKDFPHIDPLEIVKKITSRTKAIIPVDYSGAPVDYDEINKLAKKHKLIVIADAAHSLGAKYQNKKVGTLADMTVFSFHPVKLITTAEGGMVVTDNQKFYQRLLMFRTHGITKDPSQLQQKNVGPWYYEMQELGYNYRMTDMQAALGLSQAKKITKFVSQREKFASQYQKLLLNNSQLSILKIPKDRTSAWHLFPILLATEKLIHNKRQIVEEFHRQGIAVQVHYVPVHLHPYYRKRFGFKIGDFPNSEDFYNQEISLPIFPQMTSTQLENVVKITQKILKTYA